MRKIALLLFILFQTVCVGQTKSDYEDYLKEKVEAGEPLQNYKYSLLYSSDILKIHAQTFAGKSLTESEFKRMIFFGTEIYLNNNRQKLIAEVINSCDLRGVRKVSVTKSSHKDITYYSITIYVNNNYICSEFSGTEEPVKSISQFPLSIKCDKTTADNIKKSIIKLAKLNGATDIIDGDDLFKVE